MGLLTTFKLIDRPVMKSTLRQKLILIQAPTADNSSDIVDFLLDMAEISQHWSLPITITIESNP